MKPLYAVVVVLLAQLASGCGERSPSAPTVVTPPPTPPPAAPVVPVTLRVFTDPASGFSTSDVRDAQDEIVQFNTANELIWAADGTRFPGYLSDTYASNIVDARPLCACTFEIRFGITGGERRAYLTVDFIHDNDGTIVDLVVRNGALFMSGSDVYPPGTDTLSGVVTELLATGEVPLEGVSVSWLYGTGWRNVRTDRNGYYEIRGLYDAVSRLSVGLSGYETVNRTVALEGDTRADIQLVRR